MWCSLRGTDCTQLLVAVEACSWCHQGLPLVPKVWVVLYLLLMSTTEKVSDYGQCNHCKFKEWNNLFRHQNVKLSEIVNMNNLTEIPEKILLSSVAGGKLIHREPNWLRWSKWIIRYTCTRERIGRSCNEIMTLFNAWCGYLFNMSKVTSPNTQHEVNLHYIEPTTTIKPENKTSMKIVFKEYCPSTWYFNNLHCNLIYYSAPFYRRELATNKKAHATGLANAVDKYIKYSLHQITVTTYAMTSSVYQIEPNISLHVPKIQMVIRRLQ